MKDIIKDILKAICLVLVFIIVAMVHEIDMYNEYKAKGKLEHTSWVTNWDFSNKE